MNTLLRVVRYSAVAYLAATFLVTESAGQVPEVSLQELTEASTSVVLGTTTQKESYWDEGRTKILTNVTILVDEAVKGEAARESVITIPGGQVGNTLYDVSDMPVFVEGREVLVFLWRHPTGRTLVTAGMQGKLDVIEDIRTGRKIVPGARRLIERDAAAGKTASGATPGSILLDDVLTTIRSTPE